MSYDRIIDCELRDIDFKREDNTLVEEADRFLHDERALLRDWSGEDSLAEITLGERAWRVVGVTGGCYVLLNHGPTYILIDVDNIGQYARIEFAEVALKEMVNRAPVHLYQRALAMQKLMELWV